MDGVEISWHAPKIFWLNSESHQSVYNIIGLYRLISLCSEKTKCVSHVLVSQDCHKKLSHTQQFRDKFILIQLWRLEIQNGPTGLKIKISPGLHSFWRLLGIICFSVLPSIWRSHHFHSLPHDPLPHLQSQQSNQHCQISLDSQYPASLTYKNPRDYTGHILLIQDNLPISKRLISKLNSFCKLTYFSLAICHHIVTGSGEQDVDILGEALFCLPQTGY